MLAGVVQCDVAENAWLIGALGMPLVFVPLNELESGRAIPSRRDPSRVQTLLCNNLERAYVDVGQPPVDLTASRALGEVCGLRISYHDDECGPRVTIQRGLAALPRAWSKPVVFLLRLVGWLKRGFTLCFVTRTCQTFLRSRIGATCLSEE